jgi:hypothetical protein
MMMMYLLMDAPSPPVYLSSVAAGVFHMQHPVILPKRDSTITAAFFCSPTAVDVTLRLFGDEKKM